VPKPKSKKVFIWIHLCLSCIWLLRETNLSSEDLLQTCRFDSKVIETLLWCEKCGCMCHWSSVCLGVNLSDAYILQRLSHIGINFTVKLLRVCKKKRQAESGILTKQKWSSSILLQKLPHLGNQWKNYTTLKLLQSITVKQRSSHNSSKLTVDVPD